MSIGSIAGERILITGGAGFIGSTLAGRLADQNQVIVYDSMARDSLSSRPYASHPNIHLVVGNILDYHELEQAAQECTYIVHCAGVAGIDTVVKSPVTTMRVNMIGSANVLQIAASVPRIKRVVCFSTSEVFGSLAFQSEETSPAVLGAVGEARWTYAVSKLAEEHLAYAYFKEQGLPTVTVRPFNVYGPGQVGEGAIKTFVLRALKDETICIHGDGTQIRAWCYVDDMVDGVLLCMTRDEAVGESFNIGNQRTVTTIYGLANTIIRVLGSRSTIEFHPRKSADIELRVPKIHKAESLLGYKAEVDLEEGVRRTAGFYGGRLS